MDTEPLGLVFLAGTPFLAFLAFDPSLRRAMVVGAVVSGPLVVYPLWALLSRSVGSVGILTPTTVVMEAAESFHWPLAFAISWAMLARLAPESRGDARRRYHWWFPPVLAWGAASVGSLRYYVLEAGLYNWAPVARSDILWLGVWSSVVGLVAVCLPLLPSLVQAHRHGRWPGGLVSSAMVVALVVADWCFHLSFVYHFWLIGK